MQNFDTTRVELDGKLQLTAAAEIITSLFISNDYAARYGMD